MESHENMSDDDVCLTINDFIEFDDGIRRPYHAIPETLNITLRQESEDTGPRIDTLKECGEGQSDDVNDQNQTKPLEIIGQAASIQSIHRPLPRGKLYHVFLSHCREDRDWVIDMVNRLESPEYGFKCCFADRDFDLGVPVFQNITKCIHSSRQTVIVLSPEFLESPWCSYETRITLEMDLEIRQRLLIPIMLRYCKMPDFIGRLTYIEVQNEHFWKRFVSALGEDDAQNALIPESVGSSAIMSCPPFQYNPHYINTEIIVEVPIYNGSSCCSTCDTELLPSELMRYGLQIRVDEYRDIVATISNLFYVKQRGCFNKVLWLVLFLSVVPFAFLFGAITYSYYGKHNLNLFTIRMSLSTVAVALMIPIIYYMCTLKAAHSFSKTIEAANKIATVRNLMVFVKDYGCCSCPCDKMAIIFHYFDWKPCVSRLKSFLQPPTETPNEEINDANLEDSSLLESAEGLSVTVEDEIENKAFDLLIRHATEYGQLLVGRRSVNPSEQRHTRQGECLCQFVESILQSGRTSCLDCIFRTKSRYPWRRYCSF